MQTSTSSFNFKFKIEPLAGGGFVARCPEQNLELQAPTLPELKTKLREKLLELTHVGVDLDLPGGAEPGTVKSESIHIEKKFTISKTATGSAASGWHIENQTTAAPTALPSSISDTPLTPRATGPRGLLLAVLMLLVAGVVYVAAAAKGMPKPLVPAVFAALVVASLSTVLARRR